MSELAINAISVMVPGEPVAWSRTLGSGRRRFTAPAIRRYKAMVAMEARMAIRGGAPMDGPLILRVDVFRSPPQSWSQKRQSLAMAGLIRPTTKPDGSNYLKGIEDALNGILYVDDALLVSSTAEKWYGTPRIEISITRWEAGR